MDEKEKCHHCWHVAVIYEKGIIVCMYNNKKPIKEIDITNCDKYVEYHWLNDIVI